MWRRIARARVLALMLAALVGLPGCALLPSAALPPDVVYPSIEPVAEATPLPAAELSWSFEGSDVRLTVQLDPAVYEGADRAEKSVLLFRDLERDQWIPDYYRAFIDEPHQEPLYDALLAALRAERDSRGLDSDRYAELIVSMVQALMYRTDPVNLQPKFPIETMHDLDGDCDDKTLLAAALLAREGYDVSMLLFSAEEHMALGIRTNGNTYGKSGYGFIELTTPSLIGWIPKESADGVELVSEPMVVRIGDGTLAYGAGDETDALRSTYEDAVARSEQLVARIEASQSSLDDLAARVKAERTELERLQAAGELAQYNARVPGYNKLVVEYNDAVTAHNALVAEQNDAADRAGRIIDGQTDRYGLSRWLAAQG
jgi:hypothetical protein